MYYDRIAFSCESEWVTISTSDVTKWYRACSAHNHPLWDGDLAGMKSLVGPQCGHKVLGAAPGSWRGPGWGAEPTAQSAVACSVRTRHFLDLERLALILQGATPAPGETLQEELGAPAGVASGAGSQLCSLPGAGVAPHLTWEGVVGDRPKALLRAHRNLKGNVGSPTTVVIDTVGGRAS